MPDPDMAPLNAAWAKLLEARTEFTVVYAVASEFANPENVDQLKAAYREQRAAVDALYTAIREALQHDVAAAHEVEEKAGIETPPQAG